MKKTIYLTILTIVTILCVILGSLVHLLGWFSDHLIPFSFESEGEIMEGSYSPQNNPHNIVVDADLANITIQEGDNYEVEYTCPEKYVPTIDEEGDTLTISQSVHKINVHDNSDKKIILTIPNHMVESLSITADMGGIYLDKIEVWDLTLSADMGDIEICDSSFDTADIEADLGQIRLKGDCTITNGSILCDAGNIETDNLAFEELEVEASLGNISLNCDLFDPQSYTIDAETSLGKINIDGKNMGTTYSCKSKTDSDYYLDIENDMGNISVNGILSD